MSLLSKIFIHFYVNIESNNLDSSISGKFDKLLLLLLSLFIIFCSKCYRILSLLANIVNIEDARGLYSMANSLGFSCFFF